MAARLLLRIVGPPEDDRVEWIGVNARGEPQGEVQRGTFAEAGMAAHGRPVTVAACGADAMLTGARVPGRNRSRAQAAIPFALEEGLVEDVSAYHFVAGRADRDSCYPVVVVPRAYMDGLLERLREVGIQPVRVVSEAELLSADGGWTVLADGPRCVVRLGPARGYSTEADALQLLLEAALSERGVDEEAPVLTVFGDSAALADELGSLTGVELRREAAESPMHVLARGLAGADLNLLQADYGRGTQFRKILRQYRPSAVLAMLLVALLSVAGVLEHRRLVAENARLQGEIEAVFRTAFPDVRRIVNPRAQMQQRLRALRDQQRGGGGFLELLAATAAPLAANPKLLVNSLVYRRGRLDLDVEATQLQSLDALQVAIARGSGISASVESAKSEQERVRGRVRVAQAGGS